MLKTCGLTTSNKKQATREKRCLDQLARHFCACIRFVEIQNNEARFSVVSAKSGEAGMTPAEKRRSAIKNTKT